LYTHRYGLIKKVAAAGLALMVAGPCSLGASAQQTTPAQMVVVVTALSICMREEGHMTREEAAELATEVLENYGRKHNVSWDRIVRIMRDRDLKAEALRVIKTAGGCRSVIDSWNKR
jgi:hypothetical protein